MGEISSKKTVNFSAIHSKVQLFPPPDSDLFPNFGIKLYHGVVQAWLKQQRPKGSGRVARAGNGLGQKAPRSRRPGGKRL
jgi:hypothetical protein